MHASRPALVGPDNVSLKQLCNLRRLATGLLFITATAVSAQTSNPIPADTSDPGWLKVETLELGKRLHVNTKTDTHIDCLFGKADAETLTCGGVVFPKADIKSIKSSHRARSTFVGLGVGYGSAAVVTAIAVSGNSNNYAGRCSSAGCASAVVFLDLTLLIATPIIFHVYDLTAGTIYKAQ